MLQTLLSPGALQSPPRGEVAPHPPKSMPPEVSVHAESAPLSPRRQGAARTPCVGSWWEVARAGGASVPSGVAGLPQFEATLWGRWGTLARQVSSAGERSQALKAGGGGGPGRPGGLGTGPSPRTCGRAGLVTGEASACLQAPGPMLAGCSGKSWAVEGLGFRGAWRACSPERGFPSACVCECTYVRVHTRVCRMAPRADLHPDGRPAPCSLPGPRPP